MNTEDYLKRIGFKVPKIFDENTFSLLHEFHVFKVPFENLDIYQKKLFDLKLENIYEKIVVKKRGGFCYELNALFCDLLVELGYKSKIIAARIYDETSNLGPKYDHMCICVEIDKMYLADVGFGDLFTKPLEINGGIQSDGRNLFKIEKINDVDFLLWMGVDDSSLEKKYTFSLKSVSVEDFVEICFDKQTNRNSYFVKNTVCTKPTCEGRITIFNDKLIEKKLNTKTETFIKSQSEFDGYLRTLFGIEL